MCIASKQLSKLFKFKHTPPTYVSKPPNRIPNLSHESVCILALLTKMSPKPSKHMPTISTNRVVLTNCYCYTSLYLPLSIYIYIHIACSYMYTVYAYTCMFCFQAAYLNTTASNLLKHILKLSPRSFPHLSQTHPQQPPQNILSMPPNLHQTCQQFRLC